MKTAPYPRWTYDDYLLFPDDGNRWEIVRGEKFVTPAPIPDHQRTSRNLEYAILKFLEGRNLGECFDAPIDVVLDQDSVVQPDLIFIARERGSIVGDRAVAGAPDLVIEIRSPSSHKLDYVTKRKLYGDYGVREYWVVDTELGRVDVFVLENGVLEKKAEVTQGEVSSLVVLPGLRVALSEIFP